MRTLYKSIFLILSLFFTGVAAMAQQPALLIQRIMANPSGTDSPFEFAELAATRSINFTTEPYTIIFTDGANANATNGWKSGSNGSYAFQITSGSVVAGDLIYVGGSSLNTLISGGASCKILRSINTGTTGGDGSLGNSNSSGVLGNGGSNADGVGVFNTTVALMTNTTVPVDAIFFGTGIGLATGKFPMPVNDLYNGGKFGDAGSTFLAPDPASAQYLNVSNTPVFFNDTYTWGTARTWAVNTTVPVCTAAPVISLQTSNNLSINFNAGATGTFIQAPFVSGTLGDPTDPAATTGVVVNVRESGSDIAAALYTLTASSANTGVVPNANINIVKADGQATITITPVAAGYSNITLTLTKGGFNKTIDINYAASASAVTPADTRWHSGISDASAVIALDDNFMVIADDERNNLYVHSRSNSGLAVNTFNFGSLLSLTDLSGGVPREVDVEAATKSPAIANRIYWLGSMSNSSSGSSRPNRNRLFAVAVTGTGAATSFSFTGAYNDLKSALIGWGDANGYNFTASAAVGKLPKDIDGFNVEGMVFAPDNATVYIGLRAPLVPTANRTKALIAPILNFESWFNNGAPAGSPTFGSPIELDLGMRGIRDLVRLSNGTYIIVAGNYDDLPINSALYTWSGNPANAPVLIPDFTANSLNIEGVMELNTGGVLSLSKVQTISDNGSDIYYNDGIIAKDLSQDNYKKFRSDIVNASSSGVLPVNFTFFTAEGRDDKALLNWQLASAEEVVGYEVWRSTKGNSFNRIATLAARSASATYSYTDTRNGEDQLFYRIKAIKRNGNSSFSAIRLVRFNKAAEIVKLYPNPVSNGSFTVQLNAAGQKDLRVYDATGNLLKQFSFSVPAMEVNTNGWTAGVYWIRVAGSELREVKTLKIIVQ
jgi:Secretion system C-terminal sorting domain